MVNMFKEVIAQVDTWPQEDQEELAEYAREIAARRSGIYALSDDERTAVQEGLAQAGKGQFAN